MKQAQQARWQGWAQFRFAVIAGLLASPPDQGRLQQVIQELADTSWQHPFRSGQRLRLGFSTIERWYYQAKGAADPIAALGRKVRADNGKLRAVSEPVLALLEAQYRDKPRWSVQLHYDNLAVQVAEHPQLGPMPSYQSLRRRMIDKGWLRRREPARPTDGQQRAAQRLQTREVRSFEAGHVHGLWHLDFHHARIKVLDQAGRWHAPVALAIIDDRSRACCHLQFYLSESAQCLVHGLTQAFMKRGLPRALLTDNGPAMLAEETRRGLARLAVAHQTTLPYSPYQNGKQEVFWAQLEGRLLEVLRGIDPLGLAFVNQAAQAWAEQDYHRRVHRETGSTPLQRMLDGPDVSRPAPDGDRLRLAFSRQLCRTQRRSDATVTVDGIRYELPSRYRHLRSLTLCSPSWDKSQLTLLDPKTGAPLARLLPQDKEKNASGLRRAIEPPAAIAPNPKDNAAPPLLRKWLADYAATGLPPAYLPLEEIAHE